MRQWKKIAILLFFLATFLIGIISRLINLNASYDIVVLFAGLAGTFLQLVQLRPELIQNPIPHPATTRKLLSLFIRCLFAVSLLLIYPYLRQEPAQTSSGLPVTPSPFLPVGTATIGRLPISSCYGPAEHIGPIPISSMLVHLPKTYVVSMTSLCHDINFKPAQQTSQIAVRVVFLEINTGATKGYGAWVPLVSSTSNGWIILASGVLRGTHYTLEFQATSGKNGTVKGDLAA